MKYIIHQVILLLSLTIAMSGCSSSDYQAAAMPPEKAQPVTELVSQSKNMDIVVYKSPTCSCCSKWEEHLDKSGFNVISRPTQQLVQIKNQRGIPENLRSCHTAVIDGYVIEGHVPASDIRKLLDQRPDVVGLTAPGMPQKSPGMQPEGEKPANYDVLSFNRQGESAIFTSY